ncbi:hypothetical protein B4O97_04835 [Marispirochaeta aestuarii]|uniref:DUF5320 domain-containing protein n=1 Tax=Marispirochaeta aestuarii TaxID=1963862 RepID=A0A1Y1S0R4_9SPIO|nr:DUF5320 domain-containing protein [Marispirochaeta aestuarii]ORC36953.1 hypothetical protein B4O97_04835 [Marispirochaeta aestuarii]
MPGFDGTGPAGMGPMSGWGMGYCGTGYSRGRFAGRGFFRGGRGFARGMGRGRGAAWGAAYAWGPVTGDDQAEFLRRRADLLEEELAETRRVLQEMDEQGQKES